MHDYEKYQQAANERKRWQKNMMNQEYENSIKLKNDLRRQEQQMDKAMGVLSGLPGIGSNYEK